ncbi:MAG: hypothetical protein RL322_812 [Pseudomonadota bacterium]
MSGMKAKPASTSEGRPSWHTGPTRATGWRVEASRINLVRSAPEPRPVQVRCGRSELTVDLSRSVLVIIDMQNDFCHPLGWFGQKGIDVEPMRVPIPVIQTLLPLWRSAGGRVLWLNWGIRPDRLNLPPMVQFAGKRQADAVGYGEASPINRGRSLVTGEWGAQVVDELTPHLEDIVVAKQRLSGFWDSELDGVLRGLGAQTLFFAGVNTDRCVFSTLQDAGFLGYDCVLIKDACSTPSPGYVRRAIHYIVELLHGFICTRSALERALKAAVRGDPAKRSETALSPQSTQGVRHDTIDS